LEARAGAAGNGLWRALVELTAPPTAVLAFKANLLPGAVAAFCREAANWEDILIQAHAGSGIVRGYLPSTITLERAKALLDLLHPVAAAARGNIVLPRCPAAWQRELLVWGRERRDRWLMREVKKRLDLRDVFNPGRFVV
jgi:hypothetical protein